MTNYDDFSNAMKQIHQKISEKNVKQNCSILGAKEVPNHLIRYLLHKFSVHSYIWHFIEADDAFLEIFSDLITCTNLYFWHTFSLFYQYINNRKLYDYAMHYCAIYRSSKLRGPSKKAIGNWHRTPTSPSSLNECI